MYIVTFIVAAVFFIIAAIFSGVALAQIARNKPQARGTLTTGFTLWILGILVAAVTFGIFSV